jgi:hypothetical protein
VRVARAAQARTVDGTSKAARARIERLLARRGLVEPAEEGMVPSYFG